MMVKKQMNRGTCTFCQRPFTASGMMKHLLSCRKKRIALNELTFKEGKKLTIYHLLIWDRKNPLFWLHLEMNECAPLSSLDHYLRAIWLECCGHSSQFSYGAMADPISMRTLAEKVFEKATTIDHLYDFGSSSETVIAVEGKRIGNPFHKEHPVFLMARNTIPDSFCEECAEKAGWLCLECLFEHEKSGRLCRIHKERHSHDHLRNLKAIFNSPRTGICSYSGPAVPPY